MDFVREWLESSPYARDLGVVVEALSAERALLRLPYAEKLTNGDEVLHGGCAASLASLGAHAVTRATLGAESAPWHLASLQIGYLSAARAQGVVAEARLQRPGKGLCFVEVAVRGDDGREIAHAGAVVRARFGAAPADLPRSAGDHGQADPGRMGPHLPRIPFIGARGIRAEHMLGGTSRLVMAQRDANTDAGGGVHEGAVLALLDTAGAMASWAAIEIGPFRAGTPALQAQILAPAPKGDLVAYGRNVHRDAESFWSDVEIAGAADGRVCARGSVLYRIVT